MVKEGRDRWQRVIDGGPLDPVDPQQFSGRCEVPVDVVGGIPRFGGVVLKGHAGGWCIVVDAGGLHDGRVGNGGETSKRTKPTKSGRAGCCDSEDPTVVIITDFGVWPLAVRHKSSVPVPGVSRVDLKVA